MNEEILEQSFWENLLEGLKNWALNTGPDLLFTLLLFFISIQLVNVVLRRASALIVKRLEKKDPSHESEKRAKTLFDILRGVVKVSIWVVFMMIILKDLGLDIAPLLAGAGIAGLAIGFGAQELVKDVISGFFMLLEDQIRIGDVVSINGTGGAVEKIELRTVTLRDLQGTVHVFQNGKIDRISNMTKEWSACVFDVGVSYSSDIPKVIEVMGEVAKSIKADPEMGPKILEDMEIFGLNSFGDSAIVVKGRIKTKPGEQWGIMRAYNKLLKEEFDKAGIEIPFPQRTLHYAKES